MVGGGARVMIERGLAAERPHAACGRNRPAGARLHRPLCRPYRGPLPALPGRRGRARRAYAARGCRLAVCTNKLEWLSLRLLDALGLAPALCRHLRRGHVRHRQARPIDPARHDRACRRPCRSMPSWSGTRQPILRPPARSLHPGRRGRFRLHRRSGGGLGPDRIDRRFADLPGRFSTSWPRRKAHSGIWVNSGFTLWPPHLGETCEKRARTPGEIRLVAPGQPRSYGRDWGHRRPVAAQWWDVP